MKKLIAAGILALAIAPLFAAAATRDVRPTRDTRDTRGTRDVRDIRPINVGRLA